ncbi:MAG: hypothetical protein ACLFTA_03770 [Candidatus Nanohaloarchaea archaeon]
MYQAETAEEVDLAEYFFGHAARNKQQLIKSFKELKNQEEDPEKARKYEKKIENAQKELRRKRKDAKRLMQLEDKQIDLQEAVQASLDKLHSSINYYDRNVAVNWQADDYVTETDPLVEEMLYSLFDNSIQHGTRDVEIDAESYGEGLQLVVEDGGDVEDWDELLPGTLQREDYESTGTYLIDTVKMKNDFKIEGRENGYKIRIPFEKY